MGIDLSSSVERTALIIVEWERDGALVGAPSFALADAELVQRLRSVDWIGIEAPFGWPLKMAAAVYSYMDTGHWLDPDRDVFRYRRTESFVRRKALEELGISFTPPSVSTSRIALTALRLASLRESEYRYFGFRFDLAGADRILEVHAPASMFFWGFPRLAYKTSRRSGRREVECLTREELLGFLEQSTPWLRWAPGAREGCIESDDALDALVAALVARAASRGLTEAPPKQDLEAARREGWIHLPRKESLPELV